MNTHAAQLKRAELASGLGALVLGTGIGGLAAPWLGRAAVVVLLLGLAVHAWGMYDKHRLERGSEAGAVRFAAPLYWSCWILLTVLFVWLAARSFGIGR
ncbi:MAG: hypothetical protein ACJ8GN_28250 [Longimicrobiaceae bacterium]